MSGIGLEGAMNAVAAAIIANDDTGEEFSIFTFTANNCKAIDEAVFRYIETTVDAPEYCVIVDTGPVRASNEREFRSSSLVYNVYANFYHIIPHDEQYFTAYSNGIKFFDSMVRYVSRNPTLGGTVLGASIVGSSPPIPYKRGNEWYITVDAHIAITDNIS